jgi:hypothetical protein
MDMEGLVDLINRIIIVCNFCPSYYGKCSLLSCCRYVLSTGTSLHKLQLDGATVSEVLRLHLLSSGAKRLPSVLKADVQQRGGFVSQDDPGYEFCHQEKAILETLKRKSVSELTIGLTFIYAQILVTDFKRVLHTFLHYSTSL